MNPPPTNIITSPLAGKKRKQPDPPTEPSTSGDVGGGHGPSSIVLAPKAVEASIDSVHTTKPAVDSTATTTADRVTTDPAIAVNTATAVSDTSNIAKKTEEKNIVEKISNKESMTLSDGDTVMKDATADSDTMNTNTTTKVSKNTITSATVQNSKPPSSGGDGDGDVVMKSPEISAPPPESQDVEMKCEEQCKGEDKDKNKNDNDMKGTNLKNNDEMLKGIPGGEGKAATPKPGTVKTDVGTKITLKEPNSRSTTTTAITTKTEKREKLNWDTTKSKLLSQDLSLVLAALSELRDDFEILHSTEYPTVLATLIPIFSSIIKSLPCKPPKKSNSSMMIPSSSTTSSSATTKGAEAVEQKDFLLIGGSSGMSKKISVEYIDPVRNNVLELCNIFPHNEVLRPYAGQLMAMAVEVLRTDYEENALIAAKLIVELHKSYRHMLQDYVAPYLEFVLMSYRALSSNVQKNFSFQQVLPKTTTLKTTAAATITKDQKQISSSAQSSSIAQQPTSCNYALKSACSFLILTECPLTVILIFQLYPKFIKSNLMQLLPLMMEALGQRPPPFSQQPIPSTPSKAQGEKANDKTSKDAPTTIDTSQSKLQQQQQEVLHKKIYYKRSCELLSAQVKTLTFVTFLLSRYGDQMRPYEDHLANNVLNLFQMCPREAISTRKDLLLALKHIFLTDFRKGFYKHIDLLLDDRVLIGKHKQSEHTHLRVEAYGALATLIQDVCSKLTMIQVSRVVHLYSRVLHDASMNLPLKSQIMSVNLLLRLVDTVYHNREERASLGRDILYRIFENLVWKIGTIADSNITEIESSNVDENSRLIESTTSAVPSVENEAEQRKVRRNQMYGSSNIDNKETRESIKNLVRLILPGYKKLIWCINTYGAQREKNKRSKSDGDKGSKDSKLTTSSSTGQNQQYSAWYEEVAMQTMNVSEQKLIDNCFVWSLKTIKIFREKHSKNAECPGKDFRNALESLASSLAVMDTFTFQRVVGPRVGMLFDAIVDDNDAIIIAQKFLLQSASISSTFTSCLLKFLMLHAKGLSPCLLTEKEWIGSKLARKAEVLQKLFEILLSALRKYPQNEVELRPHLQSLIAVCLRQTTNSNVVTWPGANLEILIKLFRAIAGGKFEESYKEILPLLSTLLNGLYHIFCQTENETMRKIIIELCLTIPARLSSLLPHLSLLLRIIVPALKTNDGELINLGLRTLEFWVDNLNAEFLLPILSRDADLFSGLMLALTDHLRPAPYQYGLLTLRLLGKLGGRNRLFLQQPMDLPKENERNKYDISLKIDCEWDPESKFSLPLPLERAVFVLEKISSFKEENIVENDENVKKGKIGSNKVHTSLTEDAQVEQIDLFAYKQELLEETARHQASSAFVILRAALTALLEDDGMTTLRLKRNEVIPGEEHDVSVKRNETNDDLSLRLFMLQVEKDGNSAFKIVCKGIFHATSIQPLRDDALLLLEGLMQHMVLLVGNNIRDVSRNEGNEEPKLENSPNTENDSGRKNTLRRDTVVSSGKLQPMSAFGCFSFSGRLQNKSHCLILTEVIPAMLKTRNGEEVTRVLSIIVKLHQTSKLFDEEISKENNRSSDPKANNEEYKAVVLSCSDIFLESLLHNLCQVCLSFDWQARYGVYDGICKILELKGGNWSSQFEVELLHASIFCLKDYPDELAIAEKEALSFFFRVLSLLYGDISLNVTTRLTDDVAVPQCFDPTNLKSQEERESNDIQMRLPQSSAVCSLLIGEVGSSNPAVRFAVRHALRILFGRLKVDDPNSLQHQLTRHESTTKRLLFSKSLRNLPVPEQVATIEAFTFIAHQDPKLLPLSENLVLVFFSELLKMMSVADGEMTSESISNAIIINKDGYSPKPEKQQNSCMISPHSSLSHASGIYLRDKYDLVAPGIGYIAVSAELPIGVQFRVSSLILFHCVLKAHSNTFFDADPSSSIGNILPHIVSLLFRSLTSRPEPAVDAAHAALRDILDLSAKNKDSESPHRLPKNLLQMCIRPVLLNLRDYTKLSIPLLRGLSRLLSLLSSWFSKTLGEKLLEHLQRWTEPEKIVGLEIWKRGEEPLVAAAIIELFELLPDDSSHFVEMLVKITLKLENALPRYETCLIESPFRLPLAKYLNKHEEATAAFFINDHRLKNPIYSDLLQDIIKRSESKSLRKKLSDNKWSTALLNVCFERPLAIIRAEKGSSTNASSRSQLSANSPRNAADILSMHGINIDLTGQGQKSAALRQVLEQKKEKLQSATKDHTKAKDKLEKLKRSEATATPEKTEQIKRRVNNAQKQFDNKQNALNTIKKEVEIAQKEYNVELAKFNRESDKSDGKQTPRSMTFDALELQHQGFSLVETLIDNDDSYISEHTDVVRAFRWLWRSKGRHFRLFHEDSMPPRFNGESRVLARFLVNFARTSNDVDILFDLLRIFLQPTSSDFSFVKHFLKDTVCNSLSIQQKRRVMQRFFPVIASEGIEELKVLSIQFLILPMLKHDFESGAMAETDGTNSETPKSEAESDSGRVLNNELTSTFIGEVLFQGGKSRAYGSRLSIELLKLSTLLLEFMGEGMAKYRQDLIKFTWSLLKSDDIKTKQWACISICQFISVFPTPSKNVLQIYMILLRSHHQEAKDLACMAMDLLIPVLPERLTEDDYGKIVSYTMKILYEEGNSLPTLSHIWRTIVRHDKMFYNHRQKIVPHLIASLSKLGHPSNSTSENRQLSISMVELLLHWETCSSLQLSGKDKQSSVKDTGDKVDYDVFRGLATPESSPTKKRKYLPSLQIDKNQEKRSTSSLSQIELSTVANFLVRLILIIAATEKADQQKIVEDAHSLFQKILQKWQIVDIRFAYFDKVESLCCLEEQKDSTMNTKKSPKSREDLQKGKTKDPRGSNSTSDKSHPAGRKNDGSKQIANPLLSACVAIFTDILQFSPQNSFLLCNEEKISHIIHVCFDHCKEEKQIQLRDKLKKFLLFLFEKEDMYYLLQESCKTYLETSLESALQSFPSANQSENGDDSLQDVALFFLQTIEEIGLIRPSFPELLVNTLITVADKLSKNLVSISSKRNNANSITPSVSPSIAVFQEVCTIQKSKGSTDIMGLKKDKDSVVKHLETPLETHCLICCLRLIGKGFVPYYFTNRREKFISILNHILESSSNVKLLLAVTVQIGTWLSMKKNMGPLTAKEKRMLTSKLIDLEYCGLPEVESQPLFHAIALIVMNMHKKYRVPNNDLSMSDGCKENASFLDQSLIGCLLTTNQRLRDLVTNSFISTLCGIIDLDTSDLGKDFGLGIDSDFCFKETGERPMNILSALFKSKFDGLGSRLWTFVFVDVLLAASNHAGGIKLSPEKKESNRQKSQQDGVSSPIANNTSFTPSQGGDKSEEIFEKYISFQKVIAKERDNANDSRGQCIKAVRILANCDTELCQDLLEMLLARVWDTGSNNKEKMAVVPSLEKLLTSPTNAQFLKKPEMITTIKSRHRDINSIQNMLRAVGSMNPAPMLSIDALLFLAKNYNCWHEVRRMLETQLKELKKVPSLIPNKYFDKLESAIRRCYLELGESDVWMSMKSGVCEHPDVKWATSLDMYGKVNKAMHAYSLLVEKMEAAFVKHQNGASIVEPAPSESEISFVEDRWIALHKEMGQWAVLEDFADDTECSKLSMECAWKMRDWEKLRKLCSSPSVMALLESGDIEVKMSEIFLAIADGKLHEVENLHAQTAQLCLYKWQLLPPIYSGCNAHNELLHNFHRLVDIRESGQIMVETSAHAGGKTYPDLKNLLSAWRHRLPNDFDPLSTWDDIFQWRSHMFTAITTNFHWAEQGALATLHDRPWTAIKMAKVARKQGVAEVALLSLAKLTDCAMDVSDAFSKLREQILSFRNGSEIEKTGGLNLINTTNLEYFDPNQKGELIRLKAEFLDSLGVRTKATQAYCHAVQLCPSYARTWMSWGALCSSLADCVERQGRVQAAEKKLDKEKAASNAKKIVQYLAQSMGCFLEAIQCESSEQSRIHIPRCLQMLSKDGSSPGLLCSTFEKHSIKLPPWVWLTWIPQLLTSLCRIEARAAKEILSGILSSYPQALYFSLRSFYLERRDQERSRTSGSKGTTASGVTQTEELMSSLRKSHPSLWISLESILEELIIRFRPSYEEELLTTITALLQRADSQIEHQALASGKESDEATVRASFAKTLSRVSAKFFRSQAEMSSSTSNDERSRKSANFTLKYKEAFEKDFSLVSSSTGKGDDNNRTTLVEISEKLRKWKRILETQVALSPPRLSLMHVSPTLSAVSNTAPDLWSGACLPFLSASNSREKDTDGSQIQSSTAESETAATAAALAASRAVAMANIYEGYGGNYGIGCSSVEIPGQYSPNVLHDGKPTPELNAKLIKFESYVEISRQNEQFVRRIGMVGSDGKTHHFLLQFAVPYWTRTDERTAQLHQIFGQCFRNKILSSRRNLWFKPTAVVPIAQRLRMTADDRANISLNEIYMEYCFENGIDPNDSNHIFQEECKRNINESNSPEEKLGAKIRAYEHVCKTIPSNIFALAMNNYFNNVEKYFYFQRSYASQLAVNSLLQYAFDVGERSPPKLIFNRKNGHVLSPDFRFSYSNQGFLDEEKAVPFRLTRNIEEFIGAQLMKGIFKPALSSAASAICANGQNLQPALQLLTRDDIVSWYLSKSAQRDGTQRSTQDLERHLSDRVKKNVYLVQNRLRECAPRVSSDITSKTPMDDSVEKLILMATKPDNLVSMPLSFCPWL